MKRSTVGMTGCLCRCPKGVKTVMHTVSGNCDCVMGVGNNEGDIMPPHFPKGLRVNSADGVGEGCEAFYRKSERKDTVRRPTRLCILL